MKAQWLSNSWWKTHHLLVWEIHPVECLPKKIQQLAFESNMYPKIMKATCTDCVQRMLSLSLFCNVFVLMRVFQTLSISNSKRLLKLCTALNNLCSFPRWQHICKGLFERFKHKQSLNKSSTHYNLFYHICLKESIKFKSIQVLRL